MRSGGGGHTIAPMKVQRFADNPIIRPEMLPGDDGGNINGPSLIRVPAWAPGALGRYYLYFAHHGGQYIRLAYADDLAGPWRIHAPGVLPLADTPCEYHIASPDMHVDDDAREIRMYYHGVGVGADGKAEGQFSYLATSPDGLRFAGGDERLGHSYFRVFQWGGWYYALRREGELLRSRDGRGGFTSGPHLLQSDDPDVVVRHVAVQFRGDTLRVFYSRLADTPERILLSTVRLTDDWREWTSSAPVTVLQPETDYEGANLPLVRSANGAVREPVHALRDPCIYEEAGRTFLLYSVAGESGIAIAELTEPTEG